uniref:Uncharacterized protein n=1 Tax=viral metagenome TaxID=1070528 RepID=A0A6C0LJJ0_9ZZZZ
MPGRMRMVIHNGNPSTSQILNMEKASALLQKSAKAKAPRALNSSMINRIHNLKPGCGGCGK